MLVYKTGCLTLVAPMKPTWSNATCQNNLFFVAYFAGEQVKAQSRQDSKTTFPIFHVDWGGASSDPYTFVLTSDVFYDSSTGDPYKQSY